MLTLALALTPLVTVSFAPLPLPKALERLSEASGERLTCAKALNDETLLARLKNADLARVKREIATTFDAKWDFATDRWVLKPDDLARRRRLAAAEAKRMKVLLRSLTEVAQGHAKEPKKLTADDARGLREEIAKVAREDGPSAGVESRMPASRASARLAALLGPTFFLSLQPEERVVFAENPTPMQRAFPAGSEVILDECRREHDLVFPGRPIARFRLIVWNSSEEGVALGLEGIDAVGADVEGGDTQLEATDDDEPPVEEAGKDERPLVLSPEAKAYARLMGGGADFVRDDAFEAWRSKLLDPVKYEPTAWSPGQGFVAAAEALDVNLVGCLGDYLWARYPRLTDPITPTRLLQNYRRAWSRRDGWIVVRPDDLSPSVSRIEVRSLIARAVAQGGLGIDDAADWMASHPDSYYGTTWIRGHLGAFLPSSGSGGAATLLNPIALGFWKVTTPPQRTALRRGETIPFASLPTRAKEYLLKEVYWEDALADAAETNEIADDEDALEPIRREITETLPYGLAGSTVSMKVSEEPVAMAWSAATGEPVARAARTADGYGNALARSDYVGKDLGHDRFRIGLSRKYELIFSFKPTRLTFTEPMTESFFDPSTPTIDALPEAFRKGVEAARKAYVPEER